MMPSRIRSTRRLAKLASVVLLTAAALTPLMAIDLGDVVKGGAVVVLVKTFGKDINKAINTVLMNRKADNRDETKVVPIISVGSGAYVGAAQVIGKKEAVDKVEAVAQLEVDLPGKTRGKILVPIDNALKFKDLRRVYGVGLSALIDLKL